MVAVVVEEDHAPRDGGTTLVTSVTARGRRCQEEVKLDVDGVDVDTRDVLRALDVDSIVCSRSCSQVVDIVTFLTDDSLP